MGPDGTFVITWTSTAISSSNTNTPNSEVLGREYSADGVPVNSNAATAAFQPGGSSFLVSKSLSTAQFYPDVAMDANDDFVFVWEGDFQSSSTWGVYGAYYTNGGTSSAGTTVVTTSGPALLNNTPNMRGSFTAIGTIDLHDTGPRVAMDPAGNFVITWANVTTSTSGYNVFAQRFRAGGTALAGAFMVNDVSKTGTNIGWQVMPAVGVDANGDFTIVWTSYGEDNSEVGNPTILDYGIYTRMYNADGTPLAIAPTEFRVNATTLGNQVAPAVNSQNASNDSIIAWVGPDTAAAGTTAIFLRDIDPPGPRNAVQVTTTNPPISVSNATVLDTGSATKAEFTISLAEMSTLPVAIGYNTANGTAIAGSDYTAASGVLVFAPGQRSKTVTVNVAGMAKGGLASKTFQVDLVSPTNATMGRSAGTGTIVDSLPGPLPKISVADISVPVGAQATQAVFTITLSSSSGQPVTMIYGTAASNGPVVNPAPSSAYTPIFGTLTFPAGTTTETISVPVAAMKGPGKPETFVLNLANASGGKFAKSWATATLVDTLTTAVVVPALSVANTTVNVGGTATQAVFTVSLSAPPPAGSPVTVSYGTGSSNGPTTTVIAAAGTAYTPKFGTLTFTAGGPTSQTVAITVNPFFKAANQAPETFVFNLAGAVNATYARSWNTATLVDVLQALVVTSNPRNQTAAAGQTATFTATASGTPTPTVQWQVSTNGTSFTNIAFATSPTYSFKAAAAQSGNSYRAIFTNSSGTATTTAATLQVGATPVVTTNPLGKTVTVGQTAAFTAAASGSPVPTVQWQVSTNGGMSYKPISGATSTTYSFKSTAGQSGSLYEAVFTNSIGATTSSAAKLVETAAAAVMASVNMPVSSAGLSTANASSAAFATIASTPVTSGTSTAPVPSSTVSSPTATVMSSSASNTGTTSTPSVGLGGLAPAAVDVVFAERLAVDRLS